MLDKAILIAAQAHLGQKDKYESPYILHPLRMALRFRSAAEMIVAVLHDVVEDNPDWSFDRLRQEGFSEEIIPTAIHYLLSAILIFLLAYTLVWPNWQILYTTSIAPLDEWRQLLRGSQAQRLVESSLPFVEPNSIIWGDWEQYTPLKYYQLINGWRPDVTVRNPLDRWPEKVAAAHAAGQPVYFTRKPTDLIGTPNLTMLGPFIYLQTSPQLQSPSNLIPLNASFENELELIGYRAKIWPQDPILPPPFKGEMEGSEGVLQLMLYWRAPHKLTWDYALSLRLLDSAGQELYKKDSAHPVLSSYPTTLWAPGEVVGDYYELPLPPASGPLTFHLLPYRTEGPGQWHNLTFNGIEGIKLGPFEAR